MRRGAVSGWLESEGRVDGGARHGGRCSGCSRVRAGWLCVAVVVRSRGSTLVVVAEALSPSLARPSSPFAGSSTFEAMRTPTLRLAALAATLSTAALAAPLDPRQAALEFGQPYVGAPSGDIFRSEGQLECEMLRISFGGGDGPPYSINFVRPPASHNASLDDVDVLERFGYMGMPGFAYADVDSMANLTDGTEVALQVIDRSGQVGYSVNRHGPFPLPPSSPRALSASRSSRATLPCSPQRPPQRVLPVRPALPLPHRRLLADEPAPPPSLSRARSLPGAFWPPSRWDGTHFSIMLLVIFLGGPFSLGFLASFQREWVKARQARRTAALEAGAGGGAGSGDVQLQERGAGSRGGAGREQQHVLGDDDDERTSLEDEDRPLLLRGGDGGEGAHEPESAPPAYEEAIKEDSGTRPSSDEARV